MKNPAATANKCPCGQSGTSKKPLVFADCCGRYLNDFGNTPAPSAESLMRSRYSAFVLNRNDYLRATWHASTRPADVLQGDGDGDDVGDGTQWLGLDVKRHTVMDTDNASVEFVARYRLAGRATRLHELSFFVRELGRWYYLKGDDLAP